MQLAHVPWLELGCKVPGEHGVWLSEPVEHDEPAGHSEHWALLPSPRSLLKRPAVHGSGADASALQYEPATHSRHAVAPLALMNLPASQLAHSDWRASGLTVPGAHGVAAALPTLHHVPAWHVTHWLGSVITSRLAFLCVPAGQGSGALEPLMQ